MPRLSVWALRVALLYLLAGFTFGALLLAHKGQPFWPAAWSLLVPHITFLLFGWTAQLALGVAFWILPRYPGGSRGNETLAAAALLALNVGIVLASAPGIAAALGAAVPSGVHAGTALAGRILEAAAGMLFALHAWGRIKPLYPART